MLAQYIHGSAFRMRSRELRLVAPTNWRPSGCPYHRFIKVQPWNLAVQEAAKIDNLFRRVCVPGSDLKLLLEYRASCRAAHDNAEDPRLVGGWVHDYP